MHLTPRELDKLILHGAGFLAQKRLARGLRLNYPEAVALIASQTLEFIRDGRSVSELMDLGRQFLGRAQVMDGVPEMIHEVQVEGTFPDGTKLVTVHEPIVAEHGDLELALQGSFLPVPSTDQFSEKPVTVTAVDGAVGEMKTPDNEKEIVLNARRETASLSVTNQGDRPIQVGSHYPFIEVNRALVFDRAQAYGKRLDIPAGTAVRFEPGDAKTVHLVEIAGRRVIRGGNALADGEVNPTNAAKALASVRKRGFGHQEDKP